MLRLWAGAVSCHFIWCFKGSIFFKKLTFYVGIAQVVFNSPPLLSSSSRHFWGFILQQIILASVFTLRKCQQNRQFAFYKGASPSTIAYVACWCVTFGKVPKCQNICWEEKEKNIFLRTRRKTEKEEIFICTACSHLSLSDVWPLLRYQYPLRLISPHVDPEGRPLCLRDDPPWFAWKTLLLNWD